MLNEKLIAKHIKQLGCSREDAIALIEYDEKVDKGLATEYDLTKEQQKNSKEMTIVGTRSTGAKTERKKAENPTKNAIIHDLSTLISEKYDKNVRITNENRSFLFNIDGNDYEIVLSQKRKAKN